jgi:hypothetical protein
MDIQKIESCLNFISGIVEETKDRIETEFNSKVSICATNDEETEKTISDLRSALIELNSIKLEISITSNPSIRIVEEVRADYTDEQNLTHIDVWFKGEEEGKVVAVVDRDTQKTIWKDSQYRNTPLVREAISDVLKTIPFSISDRWTIYDVLELAAQKQVKLIEKQAIEVLKLAKRCYDAEQGINYDVLKGLIDEVLEPVN